MELSVARLHGAKEKTIMDKSSKNPRTHVIVLIVNFFCHPDLLGREGGGRRY